MSERASGQATHVALQAVFERGEGVPWGIRLRIALDALAHLTLARTGTLGARSNSSGLHLGNLRLRSDGVVASFDVGDATGADVLVWEILAGRPAPLGQLGLLPRLGRVVRDAPPDVDDVFDAVCDGRGAKVVDELFDELTDAGEGALAPHDDVRRFVWSETALRASDVAPPTPPHAQAAGSLRVVVVESVAGGPFEAAIAAFGYEVDVRHDLEEGLAAAIASRVGCVVCDLSGGAGDTFAQRLRKSSSRGAKVPLIVLAGARDRLKGFATGADVCLLKPVGAAQVAAQVAALIGLGARLAGKTPGRGSLPSIPDGDRVSTPAVDPWSVPDPSSDELAPWTKQPPAPKPAPAPNRPPPVRRPPPLTLSKTTLSAADADAPAVPRRPPAVPLVMPVASPIADPEKLTRASPASLTLARPPIIRRKPTPPPMGLRAQALTGWRPLGQRSEEAVSAIDVADGILLAVIASEVGLVALQPGEGHFTVAISRRDDALDLVALPEGLGRATAARLLILASLDVALPREQIGRIRLNVADGPGSRTETEREVLVIARPDSHGIGVEMKRIATNVDAAAHSDRQGTGAIASGTGYEIVREIGRGGMGIVYLAVHRVLGTKVALKVLHPEMAAISEVAARFVAEGRAAARARHPGIVQVTDFGALPDGRAYLVMEHVEGATLEHVLTGWGALPMARAVAIAKQVATALHAVHECEIIHRDIKPANVFVDANDRVKIGDFGIAKIMGATKQTSAGMLVGTPLYMAPEQFSAEDIDRRADVYALGCMLFEMFGGQVPYDAATAMGIMTMHVSAPIPEPTSPFGRCRRSPARSFAGRWRSIARIAIRPRGRWPTISSARHGRSIT